MFEERAGHGCLPTAPESARVDLERPRFSDPARISNSRFPVGELDPDAPARARLPPAAAGRGDPAPGRQGRRLERPAGQDGPLPVRRLSRRAHPRGRDRLLRPADGGAAVFDAAAAGRWPAVTARAGAMAAAWKRLVGGQCRRSWPSSWPGRGVRSPGRPAAATLSGPATAPNRPPPPRPWSSSSACAFWPQSRRPPSPGSAASCSRPGPPLAPPLGIPRWKLPSSGGLEVVPGEVFVVGGCRVPGRCGGCQPIGWRAGAGLSGGCCCGPGAGGSWSGRRVR